MGPEQMNLELLKLAADARKLEIDNLWKRSLFFWGFITAAAYAYWEVYKFDKDVRFPLIVLSHFGFLCSEFWLLINVGSKFWYTAWEKQTKKLDPCQWVFYCDPPGNKYPWEVRFLPSKDNNSLEPDYYSGVALTDYSELVPIRLWLALPRGRSFGYGHYRSSTGLAKQQA